MKMRLRGFTLIELLIVVAIIAILAAIAVPNFLEAQVRAKVSRVKADHRSLAVGIESYYTDWNQYPNDLAALGGHTMTPYCFAHNAAEPAPAIGEHFCLEELLYPLSTPVSYFTNPFVPDPLNSREMGSSQTMWLSGGNSTHILRHYRDGGAPPYIPSDISSIPVFIYIAIPTDAIAQPFIALLLSGVFGALPTPYDTVTPEEASQLIQGRWILVSTGPDGVHSFNQFPDEFSGLVGQICDSTINRFNALYDPSNGTVSRGDVVRTGAGVGIRGM